MKLPIKVLFYIFSILLFLFFSCSDTPPEIIQLYNQTNMVRDVNSDSSHSQFSVFLHLDDEDGIEDIDSIYLIHDQEELFWHLTEENWITVNTDNETWIGSNGIAFPDTESPAKGLFRVIVIDAAGERTAEELYFQPPSGKSGISFPSLETLEDGSMFVKGPYREHTLWYYDQSGKIVETDTTSAGSISAPKAAERISSVYVYAYSNELGCGVISGPYRLPGT